MNATGNDHYLLTPGPLTTSLATKRAMLRDWGSRDETFIALTARVRERVLGVVRGEGSHVCVPLQGSGTFAVEAALGSLTPRDGKTLVLVNGAYGRRMLRILEIMGRACVALESAEDEPNDVAALDAALAADAAVTDVATVHCETTSGLLNPVEEVAEVVARHGRRLLVDAMSAFGAVPLDLRETSVDVIMASGNKCLEGVPGLGLVVARASHLSSCAGNASSLSLDLYEQWRGFEKNGQWRFTPPTHAMAALDRALEEFGGEGGIEGRGARYRNNCRILVEGMRAMGFRTYLPDERQAPIIVTFYMPRDPCFVFSVFYEALRRQGFVIYPGKLTRVDSFRIGCIGRLGAEEMEGALAAVREGLRQMGFGDGNVS